MSEDLIMRVAALEKQYNDLYERWDNRFMDIETVIGLNHQSEVANITPFKGRIKALEQKIKVIEVKQEANAYSEGKQLKTIKLVLRDLIRKMPNKYWELYDRLGSEETLKENLERKTRPMIEIMVSPTANTLRNVFLYTKNANGVRITEIHVSTTAT